MHTHRLAKVSLLAYTNKEVSVHIMRCEWACSHTTLKLVLNGHSKRRPKLVFKTDYRLMQVKSIAECSKGNILQYFRPQLSYHFSLRSLFCLCLSVRLRQVLLYHQSTCYIDYILNPLRPNGVSHLYQLDQPISVLWVVGLYFSFSFKF